MIKYLTDLDYSFLGNIILILATVIMILLLKKPIAYSHKSFSVGIVIFTLMVIFDLISLTRISDYLAILGFVIITFSLIRMFWNYSHKS